LRIGNKGEKGVFYGAYAKRLKAGKGIYAGFNYYQGAAKININAKKAFQQLPLFVRNSLVNL
jgi:hypothetical protein